jgi:PEP-CTERM motif-containing protein
MRKLLWIVLAAIIVGIGASNAHANTLYTPTFTCTQVGGCTSVPTAPDVSFPSPTIINETWDGFFNFGGGNILPSPSSPTDTFTWTNSVTTCVGCGLNGETIEIAGFSVVDATINVNSLDAIDGVTGPLVSDSGTLTFTPVATATPEPSSVALMLAGVGLVFVMRRR